MVQFLGKAPSGNNIEPYDLFDLKEHSLKVIREKEIQS
jgi:hypothetical protein